MRLLPALVIWKCEVCGEQHEVVTNEAQPECPKLNEIIAERHAIYNRRLKGEAPPWADDPILGAYKFTNVFRATDRVSQQGIRISWTDLITGLDNVRS
jgi:hypothetical protein